MNDHGSGRMRVVAFAFGTRGDVEPVAVVATALARRISNCEITFITHSQHEFLRKPLSLAGVTMLAVSSAPVESPPREYDAVDMMPGDFETGALESEVLHLNEDRWKTSLEKQHRIECALAVEQVLGEDLDACRDFILINFFALEGWHLAEQYRVPCMVLAPYVVPYSAPSSFERQFHSLHPALYKRLLQAQIGETCWSEVMHWMWPLFTRRWTEWRSQDLHISACPLTDPVTGQPLMHNWPRSTPVLYGFSSEVVECPGYWPESVHVCGFWHSKQWEVTNMMASCITNGSDFSAIKDCDTTSTLKMMDMNSASLLSRFLSEEQGADNLPIFIGLSSIGSMGLMPDPKIFLEVLLSALEIAERRAVLFTGAHVPLDSIIIDAVNHRGPHCIEDLKEGISLSSNKLFCFAGSVPYGWLFPKCAMAIHHGGSGTTAAALRAGIPQIICPFLHDQFYWAERMAWIGVAPQPLASKHFFPQRSNSEFTKAVETVSDALRKASSVGMLETAKSFGQKLQLEDGTENVVSFMQQEFFS